MGFTLNQLEQEKQIKKLQKKGDKDTTNYEQLSNLPRINDIELKGNKTGSDLGITDQADIATEFNEETAYTDGCIVYHEGKLYIFNVDHAVGAWDPSEVAGVNVTDEITSNKAAIDALDDNLAAKKIITESGADLTDLKTAWRSLTDAQKDNSLYMKVNGHYMTKVTANAFNRVSMTSSKLTVESLALSADTPIFSLYEYTLGQASAATSTLTVTSWAYAYIEL